MRTYRQYCGIAKALDVVGRRWALLICRELLPGARRFTEIEANLVGLTPNLLSTRLQELEADGVVRQVDAPDGSARHAWALTEWGRELEPVLLGLGAFGAARMTNPRGHHTRARWFAISLQRRYRGGMAPTVVGLRVGDEAYTLRIDSLRLHTSDGAPTAPDLSLEGPLPAVAGALSSVRGGPRGVPGTLTVTGEGRLLRTLRRALRE